MIIDAKGLDYRTLNEKIRESNDSITINGCCGQRFIAAGMSDCIIRVNGIPGNAYMTGMPPSRLDPAHF